MHNHEGLERLVETVKQLHRRQRGLENQAQDRQTDTTEWDLSCQPDPRWAEDRRLVDAYGEDEKDEQWKDCLAPIHNEFDYLFKHRIRGKWDGRPPDRQKWSRTVRERDGHRCQLCGGLGQVAHHIIPINQDPDLALDVDNGQTLCKKCHLDVHRRSQYKAGGGGSPWLY